MGNEFKRKYMQILQELREDSRARLKEISQRQKLPISTVHAIIQKILPRYVSKYVSLLDYPSLGFHGKAHIILKAGYGRYHDLKRFLLDCECLNSFQVVNNGYHFIIELVKVSQIEVHDFIEGLERDFGVQSTIFWVLEDIKREEMKI